MQLARVVRDLEVGERFDPEWFRIKPKNVKPMILCIRHAARFGTQGYASWQRRLGDGRKSNGCSGLDKSLGELVKDNKEVRSCSKAAQQSSKSCSGSRGLAQIGRIRPNSGPISG